MKLLKYAGCYAAALIITWLVGAFVSLSLTWCLTSAFARFIWLDIAVFPAMMLSICVANGGSNG